MTLRYCSPRSILRWIHTITFTLLTFPTIRLPLFCSLIADRLITIPLRLHIPVVRCCYVYYLYDLPLPRLRCSCDYGFLPFTFPHLPEFYSTLRCSRIPACPHDRFGGTLVTRCPVCRFMRSFARSVDLRCLPHVTISWLNFDDVTPICYTCLPTAVGFTLLHYLTHRYPDVPTHLTHTFDCLLHFVDSGDPLRYVVTLRSTLPWSRLLRLRFTFVTRYRFLQLTLNAYYIHVTLLIYI